MELLFRKYFWTINLAFLALAGFLSARTVNAFISAAIAPPADLQTMGSSSARSRVPRAGLVSLDAKKLAPLFGIILPELVPESEPTAHTFDPDAEAVRTSLRISLIGTMVADHAEWSLATIRDDQAAASQLYAIGDDILGAEIFEIERLRVILLNEGRKEYIAIGEEKAPAPALASTVASAAEKIDDGNIRKLDENNYEIARDEIDKTLSNLNRIATQARIVPSFKDGVANGFKLFSIRPGSLYSKIGIQNGDVIRRINGYEINSPDKALEVYTKLKESSRIEIDLERRGSPVKKTYTIR